MAFELSELDTDIEKSAIVGVLNAFSDASYSWTRGMINRGEAAEMVANAYLRLIRLQNSNDFDKGFLAGFLASGEGWNGEHPFEGKNPEDDEHWVMLRAQARSEWNA